MGKKLAPTLYRENIIQAKEPQENAFFFPLVLFFYCFVAAELYFFFSNLYDFQPSYVK